jgi:cytochrome c556
MHTDEPYYVLIAAVLTGNATMAQQAELEQLLAKQDSVQQAYNELSHIYRQPLPVKTEKFDAHAAFLQLSKKILP